MTVVHHQGNNNHDDSKEKDGTHVNGRYYKYTHCCMHGNKQCGDSINQPPRPPLKKRKLPYSFRTKNKGVGILRLLPLFTLMLITQHNQQPILIVFVHGLPSQASSQISGSGNAAGTFQKSTSLEFNSKVDASHDEKSSASSLAPVKKSSASLATSTSTRHTNSTATTTATTATSTATDSPTKSSLVQVYEHEHFSKTTHAWVGGSSPQSTDRWTSSPTNHGRGVKILPPPSELLAPKGYEYTGDWKIDVTSSISTAVNVGGGIGGIGSSLNNISKDELGWEYFISNGVGRRRRRWLRTVVEVPVTTSSSSLSSSSTLLNVPPSKSMGIHRQRVTSSRPGKGRGSVLLDPLDLPGYHLSKRILKDLRDSFNFKGFGMTGSKSLITKGIGIGCRLPLSANFDFWESRPFLPLVNCSLIMYYPLRIAFVLNASLPMGLFKTVFWTGMDWIAWLVMTIYCIVWKSLMTDLVWKLLLWNSIKVMGKILALGPEEEVLEDYGEYNNGRDDDDYNQHNDNGKSQEDLMDESFSDDDYNKLHGKKKFQDEKRAIRLLGREYPSMPQRRAVIYSRAISERLGVNVGMHLSKARGFEVRYAWWHSYLPTVDYLNSKIDSIKSLLMNTPKASKMKKGAVSRLLGGKVASLGLVWGGFSPEAPYYSCSSSFSISGLYPGDALRKFREIQAERRSRQLVEKQLDSRLKKNSEALSEEEYEEVIEVKVGAK
jgi:hypothetical protein